MKKSVALLLILLLLTACSADGKKPDDTGEAVGHGFTVTMEDGSKRDIKYGEILKFSPEATEFSRFDSDEKESFDKMLPGPFGVEAGADLDSFIRGYEVAGNYAALLLSKDGYTPYGGEVKVESGKTGFIYLAYMVSAADEWKTLNYTEIVSLFTGKAVIRSEQRLVLVSAAVDSENKLLYQGILAGTYSEIADYLKK